MYQIYIDDEKCRLALALDKARTTEEIKKAADAIAKVWIALGCPDDM